MLKAKVPKTIWRFIARKDFIILNGGFKGTQELLEGSAFSFSVGIRDHRFFTGSVPRSLPGR
jgi:hypothetical protein